MTMQTTYTSDSGWSTEMGKVVLAAGLLTGLSEVVGDVAVQVAALAAGIAGLFYIHRHVIRPAAKAAWRVWRAVGVLERLPEWMDGVDERLDRGDAKFDATQNEIAALVRDLGVQSRDRV